MGSKVAIIFGAGARVGAATAAKFFQEGWKVAAVARTIRDEVKANAHLTFAQDLADPHGIQKVFDQVSSELGPPSAVIYNVYSSAFNDGTDPFGQSVESFITDTNVNTNSLYAAAKAAVASFSKLPEDAPKTFNFTGNALIHTVWPSALGLGLGKCADAYLIEAASIAYKGKSRWYFVDERQSDGQPGGYTIDGPAHAETFFQLSTEGDKEAAERGWEINFVPGAGIKYFGAELGSKPT